MTGKSLLALTAALLAAGWGCSNDSNGEQLSIVGFVVDADTGAPLSGATVTLYQDETTTATTDANGAFTFPSATTAHGAVLSATASGYETGRSEVTPTQAAMAGDAGAAKRDQGFVANVTIELSRVRAPQRTRIMGTVQDGATGLPIEGAVVTRYQDDISTRDTDANGAFVFDDAHVGHAVLTVSADGYVIGRAELSADDFTPDSLNMGDAGVAPSDTPDSSASVTIQLNQGGDFSNTQTISGHVFVQTLVPAVGATVMLVRDADVIRSVTTTADGAFQFPDVVFETTATEYQLIVAPYDSDADGWGDTGIDITDGVCVFGVTFDSCPSDVGAAINGVVGLTNVVLELEAPNHSILKNNACDTADFISPNEDLYMLFDSSVRQDSFDYVLTGPDQERIASTVSWVGNYLVKITPDEPFSATQDNDDTYMLEVRGLVFADGFVFTDPTNNGDVMTCNFRVGQAAEYLDSPAPRLWMNADEMSSALDANAVYYQDAEGALIRTDGYNSLDLVFDHVPGAYDYDIYARESFGDDRSWTQVATINVGEAWSPSEVMLPVDLSGMGVLGATLGFGNQVEIIVLPKDSDGHTAPIDGSQPVLMINDGWRPRVLTTSWSTDAADVPGTTTTGDLSVDFGEPMNVAGVPSALPVVSGRISDLSLDTANLYWGAATPTSASATMLFVDDAAFTVTTADDVLVASNAANGDDVLEAAEMSGSVAMSGFSIDQTLGWYDSSADTVTYHAVSAVNTVDQTLTVAGVTLDSGDVLFDPRTRTDELGGEAVAGSDQIVVGDASSFFVGHTLEIGIGSSTETRSIVSIDSGSNTLTLSSGLGITHPAGTAVIDSELATMGDYDPRPATTINAASNTLLANTELNDASATLVFNAGANFADLTVGDAVLLDADGDEASWDDRAIGIISQIRTVDSEGATITDANANAVVELDLDNIQFLGQTTSPMVVDPGEAYIVAQGDTVLLSDAVMGDSSGNTPINAAFDRANLDSGDITALTVWGN